MVASRRAGIALGLVLVACPADPVAQDTSTTVATSDTSGTSDTGATAASVSSTTAPTSGGPESSSTTTAAPTSGGPESSSSTTEATGDATDPSTSSTSTSTTADTETGARCGDGVLDPGEACDDGNGEGGDGCLPDCNLGPGGAMPPFGPKLMDGEGLRCLMGLDDALALGGSVAQVQPAAGIVRRFPLLPEWGIEAWSHVEPPFFEYGRLVVALAAAADGDIIAAGRVDTSKESDSAGYLWLARLSPAGELLWRHDFEDIAAGGVDLALAPDGQIVVASALVGVGLYSSLHGFSPEGVLLWTREPHLGDTWLGYYDAVAVADGGTIFTAIREQPEQAKATRMQLLALTPDGQTELWSGEHTSPTHEFIDPQDLVVTAGGDLVVAVVQGDPQDAEELALGGFKAAGAALWWTSLPASGWSPEAVSLVPAPDGGVFVATFEANEMNTRRRVARLDGGGAQVWLNMTEGPGAVDAAFGPGNMLYVLAGEQVHPHLP